MKTKEPDVIWYKKEANKIIIRFFFIYPSNLIILSQIDRVDLL